MTPLERWLAVLNRETPDRVPTDYWATAEANEKLMRHLGCSTERELFEALHIDRPVTASAPFAGRPLPEGEDEFGCRSRTVRYETGAYGEITHHPLAEFRSVEEIEAAYRWPSADDYDYSVIPAQLEGWEDYPVRCGGSEPFLAYCYLRGQEQALMDLVLEPEMVHYCLDRLFDLAHEKTRRMFGALPVGPTLSYVAEDLGSQESLLMSRAHFREFLFPRMKRMAELVHEAGAFVFCHSDGAIRPLIPDLIEFGTDALNPIQWRCAGMAREGLKADFGDRVIFHGGVDNQYTLAFGSVEEVRQEVRDNIRILGAGGGHILAPCHNIQAVSPPENIVAMYETAHEHGWR